MGEATEADVRQALGAGPGRAITGLRNQEFTAVSKLIVTAADAAA